MRTLVAVFLMFGFVSVAAAQEAAIEPVTDLPVAEAVMSTPQLTPGEIVEARTPAGADTEMRTSVDAEERELTADDAAAVVQTQRGSFLWYVAVLVVAGVILAVVL